MPNFEKKETQIQIGALAAAALFFISVGWIFGITPVLKEIKDQQAQLVLENKRHQLLANIEKLKSSFEEIDKGILDEVSRHTLVGRITNLAKQYNIQVLTLEPVYREAPLYNRAKIAMTLNGGFVPIVRFVKELETMQPPLQVLSLTVGEVSRRANRMNSLSGLSLSLEVETLYRKKDEAKPAAR